MPIRIRVPELLTEQIPTAYALSKASGERISESAAHRLVRNRGRIQRFDAPLIEALLEVFQVKSFDELFELEKPAKRSRR